MNTFQSMGQRAHLAAHRQDGAALMVSLVLIFIMTVMGMTSLRESSLQKRMTTNAVHKSIAFQLADTTTTTVMNDTDQLMKAYDAGGENIEVYSQNTDGLQVVGKIRYQGMSNAFGYSLGNVGGFQTLSFEIRGEAHINDGQISSSVLQGVERIVPAMQ